MNAAWNNIARSIFDRPDVENISLEELDYLVEEYPYFPVIHFLRTRKLLADHITDTSGAARTALYFPNPHWLHFQMEEILPKEKHEQPMAEIMTTPSYADELFAVIPQEAPVPEAEVKLEESEMNFDDKRIYTAPETESIRETNDKIGLQEETDLLSAPEMETAIVPTPDIEFPAESLEKLEEVMETAIVPTPDIEFPAESVVMEEDTDMMMPEKVILETESTFTEVVDPDSGPGFPETETEITASIIDFSEENNQVDEFREELMELPAEIASSDEPVQQSEPSPEIEQPAEESFQIPFEPLYTIDYFASQGIKLRMEEEQTDQLSVKLRSFTEWLKAMKKIHPEKLDHSMGQEEENNIRVYAETSNEPRELYTEALAEVYLQQGLRQKAAMVFEKLSLLDPSKSAYFAARIREIKEI